jgi:hypothetical protein
MTFTAIALVLWHRRGCGLRIQDSSDRLQDCTGRSCCFLTRNRVIERRWLTLQRIQVPDFKAVVDGLRSGAADFAVLRP